MGNQYLEFARKYSNLEEGLMKERDSDYLFQFSPIRKNLLSWCDFDNNESALEVGCGCGTITGLLADRFDKVVALEEDLDYMETASYLLKDRKNVSIRHGNLLKLAEDECFDYIFLIGTLEQIADRTSFLSALKKHLKEGGILVVAMDNKYALRYFAGANDVYYKKAFKSIEGYEDGAAFELLSKEQCEKVFRDCGFVETDLYYPVPDYRMPLEIYGVDNPPKDGQIRQIPPEYVDNRLVTFDEVLAYSNICKDGLYDRFAGSYLFFVSNCGRETM